MDYFVEKRKKSKKTACSSDNSIPVEDIVGTTSRHVHDMTPQANYVFTGFQKGINAILKYLLGGENDLQVISVVGMAGAGKTYLAKHLFKESSVVRHFDKMAWCIASQSYQTKDLLLTILNQINPFESDIGKIDDQEELADKLCRSLKRRRYLVVIDDVWDVALWSVESIISQMTNRKPNTNHHQGSQCCFRNQVQDPSTSGTDEGGELGITAEKIASTRNFT
ncbi:hypothetical protein Leryth_026414 [Lithospermum erythrorhizon]|nr:hypothetical protein Leryth_026414 [Lithospermum erythrorhizon]